MWRLRIANPCLPRYVCVQHPALTLEARSRPAWPSMKWTMMLLSVVHNVRQIDASMETVIILVQFVQDVDCWYKTHVKFRTLMPCLRKPCCRGDCALVRPEAGNSGRPRHWPPIHQFWKLNTLLEFFVHLPERLWVYIECTVPSAAVADDVPPSKTCILTAKRLERRQRCRQMGFASMPTSPPPAGVEGLSGGQTIAHSLSP